MNVIETRYVNGKGETARSTAKLRFLVTVSYDEATTIGEYPDEAFSDATRQAYRDNEWVFVTVTVTPEVNAVDINLPQWSSGIEWGYSPDWEQDADMNYICKHIAPDLISECRKELIEFRTILNGADLGDENTNTVRINVEN